MDWRIGDFALCTTPGSRLENRVVMVVSRPLVDPSKEDVVYWVHPGLFAINGSRTKQGV